jgi:putative ABC transport system ATP-binding protein
VTTISLPAPEVSVMEFVGLGRTYQGPPPVTALCPTDLVIRRGEYAAVVGPSGSGKSTFLNLAGLLDRPTCGVYRLDGIDTAALHERERTALRGRRIGFVFQAFHLLPHRSAMENVTLSMLYTGVPRRQRRARAIELLDRVQLFHRSEAMAMQLSGGERQRVAIARALAGSPSLLLCDEPTGNLDSATAGSVLELIEELHRDGLTVLVVTHDPLVASRAQRTITLKDGIVSDPAGSTAADITTRSESITEADTR